MYKEKLEELSRAIALSKDHQQVDLDAVEDVVRAALRYVDRVVNMEVIITHQKQRLVADEYRVTLEDIDRQRTSAHESLMATLKVANRLAALYGLPELFSFQHRRQAAEIAGKIVAEYFEAGLVG